MRFYNLHTMLLDAHNDFVVAPPSSLRNQSSRSLGHYRLLTPQLPPSLRRLYITNAHGPDIAVIQALKSYCPNLTELSISRCTMFSPRFRPDSSGVVMGCKFWDRFTADHDSYFAGEGIEDYAVRSLRFSSFIKRLTGYSGLEFASSRAETAVSS